MLKKFTLFSLVFLLCACEPREIDCKRDTKRLDIRSKRGQEIIRKCGDYIIKNGVQPYTGLDAFTNPDGVYISVDEDSGGQQCWQMTGYPTASDKEEDIMRCMKGNNLTLLFSVMERTKLPNYISAYTKYVTSNKKHEQYATAASFNSLIGNHQEAISLIQQALKHEPRKANFLRYAIYLSDAGEYEKSIAVLKTVHSGTSNYLSGFDGLGKYHSSLDTDPNIDHHVLVRYAHDLIMLKKYEEASKLLESVTHEHPQPPSKHPDASLLHLLLEKKQHDCQRKEAIAEYKRDISSGVGNYLEFDKADLCL